MVWNDYVTGCPDMTFGQLVTDAGELLWSQDGVLLLEDEAILSYTKVYAYDDCFILLHNNGYDYALVAIAFDNTGNLLWNSNTIGFTTLYSQTCYLEKMANGSYTVVWDAPSLDYINGSSINYNFLSSQGEVYNQQGGYIVEDSVGEILTPQTCRIGDETYISWGDASYYRCESDEISNLYVQKINNPYVDNQDDTDVVSAMINEFTSYPNPFKRNTTLSLTAKDNVTAEIAIYNVRGQKVRTLHQGSLTTGSHQLQWDGLDSNGSQVSTGVYFCRIKANGNIQSRKLLMIK